MSLASPETPAETLYAAVHGEGFDAGWAAAIEACIALFDGKQGHISYELAVEEIRKLLMRTAPSSARADR